MTFSPKSRLWKNNHFYLYFMIMHSLEISDGCGTHNDFIKSHSFVLSSHLDPIGDQQMSIFVSICKCMVCTEYIWYCHSAQQWVLGYSHWVVHTVVNEKTEIQVFPCSSFNLRPLSYPHRYIWTEIPSAFSDTLLTRRVIAQRAGGLESSEVN